ncbi:MAG: hypothetical protein NZV14_06605 [Bryobacteraceae bacterium]|nr:hypothetical protein [Bryobacteraceae bacterium]MDW8377814.1 hypothetical protein [Bryobacterales bacterium]
MKSFPERDPLPLPRGASADLWRHTLSQIPTVFGRLVYLAGLRDSNSGVYSHHGLATLFGEQEASEAIRISHEECFAAWLSLGLAEQHADLQAYLGSLDADRKRVIEVWSRLNPYWNLPPAAALQVERELFFTDLEALLSLLRNEFGVSFLDPTA